MIHTTFLHVPFSFFLKQGQTRAISEAISQPLDYVYDLDSVGLLLEKQFPCITFYLYD